MRTLHGTLRSDSEARLQLEVSLPDEQGSFTITLAFEENAILQSEQITRTITRRQDSSCHCVCSSVEWKQVRRAR